MSRVAVLGGGVAGLTAADELSQRGFQVEVFERRRDRLGGKARSYPSAPIHNPGDLPAEHGFRFIPGFYRHLPDTMSRIPYGARSTVLENLVDAEEFTLLWPGQRRTVLPASIKGFVQLDKAHLSFSRHPFLHNFGLNHEDIKFLGEKLIDVLSMSHERRLMELEKIPWMQYCGAAERAKTSPEYPVMMRAMTRSLVAARADEISARTGGDILIQLQLAEYRLRGHPDRLLNGPTSDVWIEPWRQKLAAAGVEFHLDHEVTGFDLDGDHLANVRVRARGEEKNLDDFEWYVCALPVEVMQGLVDDGLKAAAPSLANLNKLQTRWMNGFMLYLRRDVTMARGHTVYVDSPWALTSVSQRQFWTAQNLTWTIPGEVEGILSIDISDWKTPGRNVPRPAIECSDDEIYTEVVGELREYSQRQPWEAGLDDSNIAGYSVDQDICRPNPDDVNANLEPLLINTKDSWASRPNSRTEIGNLFLAADYVRTYTDLATMEGANESARRAVNHILEEAGYKHDWCELWPLHEPVIFAHRQHEDRLDFEQAHGELFALAKDMLHALHAAHSR
jgi:uncharacterized protein with NAD-binding domain and iron-sulfur cluster